MIRKIAHIGIAVKNLEEAERFFTNNFSLKIKEKEEVPDHNVKYTELIVGDTLLEIMQSTTPEGGAAKFIKERGEGVHHIALIVDDIEKDMKDLKAKGVRFIDEQPRRGGHNSRMAFIDSKDTYGVLFQLWEPPKK